MVELRTSSTHRDSRLTPELIEGYLAADQWRPHTLRSFLTNAAAAHPERLAAVAYEVGTPAPVASLTYRRLDDAAHRLAAGLAGLGVGAGDGVAVMLPNGVEFATAIFAIAELGAVYTGIPATYGEREVLAILHGSEARAVIAPVSFRSTPNLALLRKVRSDLPSLERIVVVGETELRSDEVAFAVLAATAPAAGDAPAVSSAAVAQLGFTSGTTGAPKGVMNTHQTLEAVIRGWIDHVGAEHLGEPPVNLVASPIGHHTGFLWGVLFSAYVGGTAVYLDRWDPAQAAATIRTEGVTMFFGAPTFLQDLTRQEDHHGRLPSLRLVTLAGAPIPRGLVDLATTAFDCYVCPAWGMTEYGIGISASPSLGSPAQSTDGRPVTGCEVRIVDDDHRPVPAGTTGRLQVRGPGLFLGYRNRPEAMAEAFGADGWFDTGDTAVADQEGYITLAGRTKDIIIRGGENIPATEVESLLFEHPDIVEAAVVGISDPRLGERAMAVVVPRDGAVLGLDGVCTFLEGAGLSKHYLPERLELLDALPKTASGKVRKLELRERYDDRMDE